MRTLFAAAVAALPLFLVATDLAQAQNYPWCAQYTTRGGARNCGFVSWQQCMATVSGVGGFCVRNYMYRGGESRVRRRARRYYY
ncbi:MAG TPA: DUF3551 domain-containing protein [Xanthobacteraceae bacterium]|jgi:hypothetical protein|nr:DUF3551 domain-containing protein [Xanthobacteraceae bacterium]